MAFGEIIFSVKVNSRSVPVGRGLAPVVLGEKRNTRLPAPLITVSILLTD